MTDREFIYTMVFVGADAKIKRTGELIRCKDCYFYIDGYCDNNVIYQMMSGDLIGVHFEPHEDFYCAMAERKEE